MNNKIIQYPINKKRNLILKLFKIDYILKTGELVFLCRDGLYQAKDRKINGKRCNPNVYIPIQDEFGNICFKFYYYMRMKKNKK